MHRFEVFGEWFKKLVMYVGRENTLVMLPIEELKPRYRDAQVAPPYVPPPVGLNLLFMSPMLRAPEIVIPGKFSIV